MRDIDPSSSELWAELETAEQEDPFLHIALERFGITAEVRERIWNRGIDIRGYNPDTLVPTAYIIEGSPARQYLESLEADQTTDVRQKLDLFSRFFADVVQEDDDRFRARYPELY